MKPSDIVYITSVHAWAMCCHIRDDDVCKHLLMSFTNPRYIYCVTFVEKVHNENETNALLDILLGEWSFFEDIIH